MTIKTGDLVMVVKPTLCCGNEAAIGLTFIASPNRAPGLECTHCKAIHSAGHFINRSTGRGYSTSRLKKIDPPAEGDSLPTRADIEVTA